MSWGGSSPLAGNHWKVQREGMSDDRVEILLEENAQVGLQKERLGRLHREGTEATSGCSGVLSPASQPSEDDKFTSTVTPGAV